MDDIKQRTIYMGDIMKRCARSGESNYVTFVKV